MYCQLFIWLLPWLAITTKLVETYHHSIKLPAVRPGAISNETRDLNHIYQICTPDWDLEDQLVCYHGYYQNFLLLGHKDSRNGWSVYCDNDNRLSRRCYMTPPDSSCPCHMFSYVGHICDFSNSIQSQEDALSNQTSEPDINREVLKYLAIAIFLGAFLTPVLLGICCYYCEEEEECPDEHPPSGETHAPNLEHTISVVGRNPSSSASELELVGRQDIPPSYGECNQTFAAIHEEETT